MKFYLLLRVLKMSRWSQNALREKPWINSIPLSFLYSPSSQNLKIEINTLSLRSFKLTNCNIKNNDDTCGRLYVHSLRTIRNTKKEGEDGTWVERWKGKRTGIANIHQFVFCTSVVRRFENFFKIFLQTSVHMWNIK